MNMEYIRKGIWSSQEIDILLNNYQTLGNIELSKMLGNRSNKRIAVKLWKMKLKRNGDCSKKIKSRLFSGKNNPMFGVTIEKNVERMKSKNPSFGGLSDEHKNKIGLSAKKWWQNPKNKEKGEKMLNEMQKKAKTTESLDKLSKSLKGHFVSKETRKKIGIKNYDIQKRLWKDKSYKEKQRRSMIEGMNLTPNKPERILRDIIERNNLPFNYVGDGQIIFGGFNPDFLSKNPKHIIEVFGDYWHNLPKVKMRDTKRMEAYAKYGYKTLIIWEHELVSNKFGVLLTEDEIVKKINGILWEKRI